MTDFVAREADRLVEEWRACCTIPSVSGAREAIAECADWIEARMNGLFDRVQRIEIPDQGPLLVGVLDGAGPGRLLLYTHYDVQPAGDEGLWTSPPFAAEVRDGKMYARGACDDKADVTARLAALEAWREARDGAPPPFTVIFISDPAEEIGSPGLEEALIANAELLRADACLWESFLRDADGRPGIGFGCRGNLEVTLSSRLLAADQHTAFASILRSAPRDLMRAVTSMTDADGTVVIEGFRDGALAPTEEQLAYAARIPLPTAAVTADSGVRPFVGESGDDVGLALRLVFEPSMSVSRFVVGADGVGSVPAQASVTLRFSLVPDQDPERALDAVRAHVAARFPDVEVIGGRKIRPAASPLDTPFAAATIAAAADVFGDPVVYPVLIGAGPGRMVLDHLGAPVISPAGTLRPDGNMHGPDEHGAIADYLDHIRFTLALLERLAATGGP
ncbi:M20/M25/M40 family metallo-hydrolase [Baekduia sp. Peel2402]|uniref:M20/M25/M40 family metallo-hydrolase n=1 Tax=Baekduia sp. Peel2402 TaxID=3458296 RepID=UPI00403EF182